MNEISPRNGNFVNEEKERDRNHVWKRNITDCLEAKGTFSAVIVDETDLTMRVREKRQKLQF